jgi:hypothetical protein
MTILRFAALASLLLLVAAARQPQLPPIAPPPATLMPPEITEKLVRLRPEDPQAYFNLAEEVADIAVEPAQIELARALYVLAFDLDRRPGRPGALSASAALGLAQIERLERDRRWLRALAGSLDKRYVQQDWSVAAAASISEETAHRAATVLGLARSGDGREARKLIEDKSVMDVLRRYERAIGSSGETGAISRITKYAQQWPCPECGNARVVSKAVEGGAALRLCSTCRGNPGPKLSEDEFIAQLRFESYLLNGIQRSWAAQTIVDEGAPLRDPDPADLPDAMGIDVTRPYWRAGAWVAKP